MHLKQIGAKCCSKYFSQYNLPCSSTNPTFSKLIPVAAQTKWCGHQILPIALIKGPLIIWWQLWQLGNNPGLATLSTALPTAPKFGFLGPGGGNDTAKCGVGVCGTGVCGKDACGIGVCDEWTDDGGLIACGTGDNNDWCEPNWFSNWAWIVCGLSNEDDGGLTPVGIGDNNCCGV